MNVTTQGSMSMPVTYQYHLAESFTEWAKACGWRPSRLRWITERGIRLRHGAAIIENEGDATSDMPTVWTLRLSDRRSLRVHYTVEEGSGTVVRGYSWDENDDEDWGIRYYCDAPRLDGCRP